MSLLSAVLQEAENAKEEDFTKQRSSLQLTMNELAEKIQSLTWSLQEYLVNTYVNFTTTKSLEQINYRNRKNNIFSEYENLMSGIDALHTKFGMKDDDFTKSAKKLTDSYTFLKDLCTAVEGKRLLDQANHEFARYNYCDAMISASDLRKCLKKIKFEGKLATALENLINQAENQYSIYAANLSVEWEDIFSWSEKKGVYHLTYSLSVQQSDPTVIKNVLKTLCLTDRLNFELSLFSNFFIDKLLHNVIRHNCDIFTEDVIAPNHTIVFNIKMDLEDQTKPSFQAVFNNLMAVFDFLKSTLGSRLENEKSFIAIFADSIRGKFFNKIIEDCIRNNLPSCDSSYQNYKNLVLELDSFNKFLTEIKFVKSEESPLNEYVQDTECVLYRKKCDKLLSDVRSMLSESLSYGTVIVGTSLSNNNDSVLDVTDKDVMWDINKPLYLPRCVISQNVKKILATIVDHLEESAKLPEEYRSLLISYIKNIVVLYQCIVPETFKVNLELCPLDIALFFNNCFYLAHGLLGPPWRATLPDRLATPLTAALLATGQELRALGLEKISLYLQQQRREILETVHPEDSGPWSLASYRQFEGAINSALRGLRSRRLAWRHVLPMAMDAMAMAVMAGALAEAAVNRILCDPRAASESLLQLVSARLTSLVPEIAELFEEPIDLDKKIEVWTKFKKLPQLLNAQLLEISQLWKNDKELSQSYTCEEVRQIIKMRFPDDKYRLKVLVEIQ